MTVLEFIVQPAEGDVVAELEKLQPTNPFATTAYFESRRRLGCSTWVIGLRHSANGLEYGCGVFVRKGRLNRTLQIASFPNLGANAVFRQGLSEFCRRFGITRLVLGTYASPHGTDPPLFGRRCTRRNRCEFVLDLSNDLAGMLRTNHRRNVKKGQKAGLAVRRTRSHEAAIVHQKLISQSMDRRRSRGEKIPLGDQSSGIAAFLESGAGELFQAIREGTVLSSVLVLRAEKGGYYQSAGTSPDGMAVGASHFLIHNIAVELKADGASMLNLGGADENSTLARFKEGFGASSVPLVSASCYVGPSWRYNIGRTLELIRSDRETLWRMLSGGWSRMLVYSADTTIVRTLESQPGLEFRALTQEELRAISAPDPTFRTRQLHRLERFGGNYAYGVFVGGQLAHVSWLLPPKAIERDPPRVIRGQPAEAEITACETLPDFRGRGIYGFAIHNLLEQARRNGIRRVFMKTASANRSSRSGIEKVGLRRVGWAIVVMLPLTHRHLIWRRFR